MARHTLLEACSRFSQSFVSAGRLHAHTVAEPGAVTQELNRCLMMVRIAATRRIAAPQKAGCAAEFLGRPRVATTTIRCPRERRSSFGCERAMDRRRGRSTIRFAPRSLSAVTQDGVELIPKGFDTSRQGNGGRPASKENRAGRLGRRVQRDRACGDSQPRHDSNAIDLRGLADPKEKFRDVRVDSGEQLTLILATPLRSACRGRNNH